MEIKYKAILVALSFLLSQINAENLCEKSPGFGKVPCCPKEYAQDCCGKVDACDSSYTVGRTPAEMYGPLKYKALCSEPLNTTSCIAGFYRNATGFSLPCPPGYVCPEDETCIIPCPKGSFCRPYELVNVTFKVSRRYVCPEDETCIIPCPKGSFCRPYELVNVTRGYKSMCKRLGKCCRSETGDTATPVLNEDGSYMCPGAFKNEPCPRGYFCEQSTEKIICPKGYYCREGTTKAYKCPAFSICKEGESAPLQNAIGPVVTIVVIMFIIGTYAVFEHFRLLKYFANHYWRAITGDLHYSVEDGIKYLITTMEDFACSTDAQLEPKDYTIDLSFSDLSLTLKGSGKLVLQAVTGEIRSGEVTAIMGPSGAGKTTLLNVVSDKAFYGKMEGILRANGEVIASLRKFKKIVGFVPQEDTMHRTLTVTEVLTFQANLRLPPIFTKKEISQKVSQTLKLLEISHIAMSHIGDEEQRGISGGQRKRVNIGMELIADPTLLFLDEPTSGLDSTSSLTVLNALRKVAEKGRLTVACVIHQPRYEIFRMFHNILLLAPGGRTVYQGSVPDAETYFASLGFVIPEHANPADFYMDVIGGATGGNFSHDPEKLPHYWIEKRDSFGATSVKVAMAGSCGDCGKEFRISDRPEPNMFSQFFSFLIREFILQFRQIKTVLLDTFLVLLAGGVLGSLYREVKLNQFLTMTTMSGMGIGLVACIPALRVFGQLRPVFWREASVGINRFSYFMAGNVSQLPQIALMPIIYLSLQYTFTAPRGYLNDHYLVSLAAWFGVSGFGYLISCVFNPRNAQMATVLFILVSSLLSGSSPTLCKMNDLKVIGPAFYSLSYARWYVEALFEAEVKHYAAVHQNDIDYFAFNRDYALDKYWVCVGVLFGYGFVTRIIAFLCLIFMNRGKQQ
ncbi:uncharacterized protein LOC135680985 [Rhopilema esculentum]|uniref:uncharacterized protein LOC135680985 n=1 Tax=Rhopilema esculentum TaxID=499914 RepID=UPI0031DDABEE